MKVNARVTSSVIVFKLANGIAICNAVLVSATRQEKVSGKNIDIIHSLSSSVVL